MKVLNHRSQLMAECSLEVTLRLLLNSKNKKAIFNLNDNQWLFNYVTEALMIIIVQGMTIATMSIIFSMTKQLKMIAY
jgi:hypothetical protein